MAENEDEAAGLAIAAFTLAQMTFWHLLQEGLLEKAGAERILRRAIEANEKGGPDHRIAAAKLANLLWTMQAYRPVERSAENEACMVRKEGATRRDHAPSAPPPHGSVSNAAAS